jgi:O-acetyl-ADP-ribose deacetylase
MSTLSIVSGDITQSATDAIVNAANERMLGGGGVDGAIHAAAGPQLLAACRAVPEVRPGVRCPVGEARITPGFKLPAKYVIHTVGPRWHGGAEGEAQALIACYRSCLTLALEHRVRTIAFPAISTGVFAYPIADACRIAVETCSAFVAARPSAFDSIRLVAFGNETRTALQRALLIVRAAESRSLR